jgi:hypothetical protein
MSMRIEIKDLNVYYGKFLAVEGECPVVSSSVCVSLVRLR